MKKRTNKRYVFWRKSLADLNGQHGWKGAQYPTIDTLAHKLEEAKALVQDDEYGEVLIFELIKVVKKVPPPVQVEDFEGR